VASFLVTKDEPMLIQFTTTSINRAGWAVGLSCHPSTIKHEHATSCYVLPGLRIGRQHSVASHRLLDDGDDKPISISTATNPDTDKIHTDDYR
jgi:hypothetical protein